MKVAIYLAISSLTVTSWAADDARHASQPALGPMQVHVRADVGCTHRAMPTEAELIVGHDQRDLQGPEVKVQEQRLCTCS